MTDALKNHWPEYLIESALLAIFMISACSFATLLEHPSSFVHQAIPDAFLRRMLMGMAMGLTAIANIYSPWGKRSGAHTNPSTTLVFYRLGKVKKWDALFYVAAQLAGAVAGVVIARAVIGKLLAHPSVNYVATVPGASGIAAALIAEVVITFILMSVILRVSNSSRLSRFTGLFAGALVMTYITFEAPISGMSMNPARTLGSALPGGVWTALWIYFTAPPIGMLAAAEVYVRLRGKHQVFCAKLHHNNSKRCIFRCGFHELSKPKAARAPQSINYQIS